ncbi:hypothetical protein EDB84DRAFT_1510772 [Lactarius hengduanensis]|nr:hypothetical protein EDB84DRAFT_1510772 [Lactarius hengduanensis]
MYPSIAHAEKTTSFHNRDYTPDSRPPRFIPHFIITIKVTMAQPVQPGSESQPDSHHVDDQLADIADQVLDQVPNLPVTDMDNIITQQAQQQQQQQVIDRLDAMLAGIDNLRATADNLLEVVNNLQAQVGALQAGVDALQAGVGALQAGAGALQARAGSAQWTWRRVDKLGIIIVCQWD